LNQELFDKLLEKAVASIEIERIKDAEAQFTTLNG
jgi:hypothetical protein